MLGFRDHWQAPARMVSWGCLPCCSCLSWAGSNWRCFGLKAELEDEAVAKRPLCRHSSPPLLKEAALPWTHPPSRALLAVSVQLLAVIDRGNSEGTRVKPSMWKNTPINASGHFGPEKLKFLKPKESQVSTITGRGFHGQHLWRQLPEICFKGYQSPRFFTGFYNKYWNKITAGIYSVNWIQSILKTLLLAIKLD